MVHLITGGSGFVGKLVARIRNRGEKVRPLDVCSYPSLRADIEFVNNSTLDHEDVAVAMRVVDVVHRNSVLVARAGAGRLYWNVNVKDASVIVEEATKENVKANIYISAGTLYGTSPSG